MMQYGSPQSFKMPVLCGIITKVIISNHYPIGFIGLKIFQFLNIHLIQKEDADRMHGVTSFVKTK